MSGSSRKRRNKKGQKVRVPFRRNRARPGRVSDWTQQARDADDYELDTSRSESVIAKGDLSRQRTITVRESDHDLSGLRRGTVVAVRGLFADVDDGSRVWVCTVRRVLRTRLIAERHPITVGDHVYFSVDGGEGVEEEGVIEAVQARRGQLCRKVGRRVHTIVANVDQAIIVSSAAEPDPKPHLIDRYVVTAHAGEITPVICMNKIDLDVDRTARSLVEPYRQLGYTVVCTSAVTGEGVDALRNVLKQDASVIAGQSGVGKSSLLNAVQPGLKLKIGDVIQQTEKGRHTTTTATLIKLEAGGYVVDTPGVRAFDTSVIPPHELEAHFVEFAPRVADCKFPDCTHTHEIDCAIKTAVQRGEISLQRYESYLQMFEESGADAH